MRQFKVKLDGQYNTRIATTGGGVTSGIIGVGVIGQMVIGKNSLASTKDRRYINCFVHEADGKKYLMKRAGVETHTTPSAGNVGTGLLIWTGQGTGQKVISAFGGTNSTIYDGTTSLGAITGMATGITETFVGTEPTLLISSSDNTAWSTSSTSITYGIGTGLTFVGDTHSNTTVDNITVSTTTLGLVIGQLLTGTGFAANTRIVSIDSTSAITVSVATTATNAGVTVTRTIFGKIIDADFPGNAGYTLAGQFAHLDGYACIMTTDGKLWASNLNTVTGWTATSYDSASAYPDKGIGCVRHKNFIIAFGTESMEFFYNAGLTPFPLAKAKAMTKKLGCIAGDGDADTITSISDATFWAGSTPQGGVSIFEYGDQGLGRISTPEIDEALALAGPNNISITSLRVMGLSFVLVNTTYTTFVYLIEDKFWFEQQSTTNLWYKAVGLSIGSSIINYFISNISTSGKVYKINPNAFVYTDDGTAFTAMAQTHNDNHGTGRRKFYSEIELVADQETTTSPVTLSYTDDDFQTWTEWGTLDLTDSRPRATRLGASTKRAWKLEHSANTGFRIEALQGQLEVGQ